MFVKPYSIISHTTDAVKSQYFTLKHIIADPLSKQAKLRSWMQSKSFQF